MKKSLKITLLILIIIQIFVPVTLQTVKAQLSGWSYHKEHEIVGSTAGAVSNYPMLIRVNYGDGYDYDGDVFVQGKCKTDFGDIRFVDSDQQTLLNYWLEEIYVKSDSTYFYVLSREKLVMSPEAGTWYSTGLHSLDIVEFNSGGYKYWGYFSGTDSGNAESVDSDIGLARSNDLINWDVYGTSPILTNRRGATVALVSGTIHMFATADFPDDTYIVHLTSTDGITFGNEEIVVPPSTGKKNQNPFIYHNPNDNKWYLYYFHLDGTTRYIKARSASDINDLDTASDVTVLSSSSTIAWPTIYYSEEDNKYYLLCEVYEDDEWRVKAWYSDSPTSGFTPCANSLILTAQRACPTIRKFGDKLLLSYSHRIGTVWDNRIAFLSTRAADFWVKIPNIPASPDTVTIYMYYGKSDAASLSDPENVFPFCDMFSGSAVDSSKWNSFTQNGGSITVSDGVVSFYADSQAGSTAEIWTKTTWGNNYAIRYKAKYPELVNARYSMAGFTNRDDPDWFMLTASEASHICLWALTERVTARHNDAGSYSEMNISQGAYHVYELRRTSSKVQGLEDDGIYSASVTTDLPVGEIYVGLGSETNPDAGTVSATTFYVDWIVIRPYVDPEPSHGEWGSEEALVCKSVTILNMDVGNWVFAEEKYYLFEAVYEADELDVAKLKFSDGVHTVIVYYDNVEDDWGLESGQEVATIKEGTVSSSGSTVTIIFPIMLKREILDTLNVDIYLYCNNTEGAETGWVLKAEDYFNIYSKGRISLLTVTGTGGRVSGGDVFEIYAGGGYAPADIFEENFVGSELRPLWTTYTPDTNQITITQDEFDTHSPLNDLQSCRITSSSSTHPLTYMYTTFTEQSEKIWVQTFMRFSDNTQGYTYLYIYNDDTLLLQVLFGYSDSHDEIWCNNGSSYYNTSYTYSPDVWYNVTLVIDTPSHQYDLYFDGTLIADNMLFMNNLNPNKLCYQNLYGTATRTTYVDTIRIWKSFAGGYGGTVQVEMYLKHFQHFHALFGYGINLGDYYIHRWKDKGMQGSCYVEWAVQYYYGGTWVEGWKTRIEVLDGRLDGSNNWVYVKVSWYKLGSLIKSDKFYSYWEGTEGTKDYFRLWIDLWFNKVNGSRFMGGRVNSYYYGMHDSSHPWLRWLSGTNWGPMMEEKSQSMFFEEIPDKDGNTISARELKLMKLKAKIYVSSDTSLQLQLRDFDVFDIKYNVPEMEGIETPTFVATKTPDMPQSGFLAGLYNLISNLGKIFADALTSVSFSFIQMIDELIYRVTGTHGVFSYFVKGVIDAVSQLPTIVTNFVTTFGNMITLLGYQLQIISLLFSGFITLISTIFNYTYGPIYMINQMITQIGDWWNGTGYFEGSIAGKDIFELVVIMYFAGLFLRMYSEEWSLDPLINDIERFLTILGWFIQIGTMFMNILFSVIGFIKDVVKWW